MSENIHFRFKLVALFVLHIMQESFIVIPREVIKRNSLRDRRNYSFTFLTSLNRLYNGATYKAIDGLTVLYLDGGLAYAETPAIPIQTISFSILCWIKTLSLPGHPVNIYSDWSTPFQFRLGIVSNTLCIHLRRASYSKGSQDIVYFCNG